MIYYELCDLIDGCSNRLQLRAVETFIHSHGCDLSTSEQYHLLCRIAGKAYGMMQESRK